MKEVELTKFDKLVLKMAMKQSITPEKVEEYLLKELDWTSNKLTFLKNGTANVQVTKPERLVLENYFKTKFENIFP